TQSPLFQGMKFTTDHAQLQEWIPLIMQKRKSNEILAATKMDLGTDVNFGTLTRKLGRFLAEDSGVEVFLYHEAKDLDLMKDGTWRLEVKDRVNHHKQEV